MYQIVLDDRNGIDSGMPLRPIFYTWIDAATFAASIFPTVTRVQTNWQHIQVEDQRYYWHFPGLRPSVNIIETEE